MKIIPAVDVLDGKVVRLTEGDYNRKTTYTVCLQDMLKEYRQSGIDHIHIIDLNGAKGDNSNETFVFNSIKGESVRIQLGGGIRSIEKVRTLLTNDIFRVIIGTISLTDKSFLDKLSQVVNKADIIIAIDVLEEVIKYNGWKEASSVNLYDYIRHCKDKGYTRFLCTDINKDGKLEGGSIKLYQKICKEFPEIALIASGGVSSMSDIEALASTGTESVVVGKAIYENKITIKEIADWNTKQIR